MSLQWFHLIASTYGSWLPGDERGFRTRHHREHIEGDYRDPPPEGTYVMHQLHAESQQRFDTVIIPPDLRSVIGTAIRERLVVLRGRVLTISVSGQHVHLQAQLNADDARIPLGAAKKHAWFIAREHGWTGKLWALRPKIIRTRSHQKNVHYYILAHAKEGAWVWSAIEHR